MQLVGVCSRRSRVDDHDHGDGVKGVAGKRQAEEPRDQLDLTAVVAAEPGDTVRIFQEQFDQTKRRSIVGLYLEELFVRLHRNGVERRLFANRPCESLGPCRVGWIMWCSHRSLSFYGFVF